MNQNKSQHGASKKEDKSKFKAGLYSILRRKLKKHDVAKKINTFRGDDCAKGVFRNVYEKQTRQI